MNVPLLTNDDWKGFCSCVNFFTRHYESPVLMIRVDKDAIHVKPVEEPKTIEGEIVIDEHKKH